VSATIGAGAEPSKSLDAATIDQYEKGNVDLPLSVLLAYARLAGIPVENLIDDERDLWFEHCVN
jgi:transcriptional regulator with XRE-family HTH domain